MFSIIKSLTVTLICFFAIACQSDDKEKNAQPNATSTNTAENPLIVPTDPAPTTTTIYDIWVLDSINNKKPDSNYFSQGGTPYFDFNSEKQSVSGYTGCNGINGKLKVQGEKIIFDSLVVTSQVCKNKDFEKKLVNGFKSGRTTYKIINDNLHLNVGTGTNLVFRKIRR